MLFLRDYGPTEVGGFGISSEHDLLFIEDVVLIRQRCSPVTVAFDDMAVAEFFDDQIDQGRRPEEFARIWVHTHPGYSPYPSSVDEETFSRVFGRSDWSVMAILACGGDSYARLQFSAGPGGSSEIPMMVDFDRRFGATDWAAWEQDYLTQVTEEPSLHEELFGGLAPLGRDVTQFTEFLTPLAKPISGEFDD